MQASKIDRIIISALFIFVFGLMLFGCNNEETVSANEMYEKCITVNEENPDICDKEFTIYK